MLRANQCQLKNALPQIAHHHVSAMFEQPKHLSLVSHRRVVRALQPMLIVYGVVISGSVLIGLWQRAAAGQRFSILHWIVGATIGLWAASLIRLTLRFEMSRRRYIEFRDG